VLCYAEGNVNNTFVILIDFPGKTAVPWLVIIYKLSETLGTTQLSATKVRLVVANFNLCTKIIQQKLIIPTEYWYYILLV